MANDTDTVARGARVVRLDRKFRWPGGRHVAVVLNVAYEGWSDGKAPGIGPMGNPLPAGAFDTNALSWGSYGATRGIERLLRALDRTKRRASVMASGVFGERTPATVRAIVEAGHELVSHCYAQDVIPAQLSPEQVRADIEKTTKALEAASGVRPRGWTQITTSCSWMTRTEICGIERCSPKGWCWSRRRNAREYPGPTRCRRRSRPCMPARRGPRIRIGRESIRSTPCSKCCNPLQSLR